MKKPILVLLVLLLGAGCAMAQLRKKKKEENAAAAQKDSVAIAAVADATQPKPAGASDSLAAELVLYKNFYAHISNNFFPAQFKGIEIEKAIALTDSLKAANASSRQGLQALSQSKIDSLSILLKKADTLQMENQTYKALLHSLIGDNAFPLSELELKGPWQVFVQPLKVIGAGHASAIVSLDRIALPDSVYASSIKQIVFLEEDLADVHFFGGKKTKCFYKVHEFSRDRTYSISLEKGQDLNMRLYVTPVPRGLQISYTAGKGAGYYMFGYMRK